MKPVAILCSDIHLSHTPPAARAVEDWYAAQARGLRELCGLQARYDCAVVIAGDLFDRWSCPPELLTFALEELPDGAYCIPGQHDLPNHNYDERRRSAYGVLARCGKICDTPPGVCPPFADRFIMHPFPWGTPVSPLETDYPDLFHIAVVHAYIWTKDCGYPDAPQTSMASQWLERLRGYDAALFGDNHKGFQYHQVWNNGTFFRRKSDERHYRPRVGLLYADGTISPHYLDTSEDKWVDDIETVKATELIVHSAEFIAGLRALGQDSLDFRDYVRRWMVASRCEGRVRELVEAALEGT